jgi:hypothetical protein
MTYATGCPCSMIHPIPACFPTARPFRDAVSAALLRLGFTPSNGNQEGLKDAPQLPAHILESKL